MAQAAEFDKVDMLPFKKGTGLVCLEFFIVESEGIEMFPVGKLAPG